MAKAGEYYIHGYFYIEVFFYIGIPLHIGVPKVSSRVQIIPAFVKLRLDSARNTVDLEHHVGHRTVGWFPTHIFGSDALPPIKEVESAYEATLHDIFGAYRFVPKYMYKPRF